jgi:site-specific recombinase XerD
MAKGMIYSEFIMKRMDESGICAENKALIRKYLQFLQANKAKQRTLDRHAYSYEKIMMSIPADRQLLKLSKDEMIACVAKINELELGDITKAKVLVTLKSLFKHFAGDDLFYPPVIAWIKAKEKSRTKLLNSDLLTQDEIGRMIDKAPDIRDRALIALMADAPIRTHELLKLQRKHINLDVKNPYLIIPEDTKTGTRRIPLMKCVTLVAEYVDANREMKNDDPLWIDNVYGRGKRMTDNALRVMLKRIARRAGIKKRVVPYTFRHTKITEYSNHLTNAQLEVISGWKHGTNMHETYEHLSDSDVTRAVRRANGIVDEDDKNARPGMRSCPRCKYVNENREGLAYCSRCGAPMEIETTMREAEFKKDAAEASGEMSKAEIGRKTKASIAKKRREKKDV